MDSTEIVMTLTTVLALALALGMGAVLLRLLREERRRSDARVAALMEAADAGVKPSSASADLDLRPRFDAARVSEMSGEAEPAVDVAGVSEMFAEPERSSPWGPRIVVAASVAALVSAAGYVLLSRDTTMTDVPAPRAAAAPQTAPLELLSLRHTQQSDSLTITGLVQNPRTGVALSRVTATAILFSADGTFLASGRAPLDFSTIAPGDESPFVVKIAVSEPVGRYRVGFRGEDGRVIAHVDRRASGTMASRKRPASAAY